MSNDFDLLYVHGEELRCENKQTVPEKMPYYAEVSVTISSIV